MLNLYPFERKKENPSLKTHFLFTTLKRILLSQWFGTSGSIGNYVVTIKKHVVDWRRQKQVDIYLSSLSLKIDV